MQTRLYLVPAEHSLSPDAYGPKYFSWQFDIDPPGIDAVKKQYQHYGFHPYVLVMAQGISDADHAFVSAQPDVYTYPDLTPGPAAGGVRYSLSGGSPVVQINKLDRNGVDRSAELGAIIPSGDDENPTIMSLASEANSDFADYEVWGTIDRDTYFEYRIDLSASQGAFSNGENIQLDSAYPYEFDTKVKTDENLDVAIPGADPIDTFYEGLNIPTDWMTPSTTYREFLRQTMAMFTINSKYGVISQGHNLFSTYDLSTRYNELTAQEQAWFDATIQSFGYDPSIINPNATFRQMLKAASDELSFMSFQMGDIVI